MSKNEGSHDPRKPWAQNHKINKIINNHGNHRFFFYMEKMRIFSMLKKKTRIFNICNAFKTFIVLGPRPLGPMGPFIFWHFLKMCFMVWDLSRSVRMVFRSPGNPLINLFHFIFFSKPEIYGTWFPDFSYFRPLNCRKYVFLGLVEVHILTFFWSVQFDLGPI